MKIPKFWVREKREIAGCMAHLRGVSQVSMEEARERLETRARLQLQFRTSASWSEETVARFRQEMRRLDDCGGEYCACILEPVDRVIDDDNVITRNRYGSLTLNSTSVCFVDVDRFPPRGVAEALIGLFKGVTHEKRLLAAVDGLSHKSEEFRARVYRTAHGWRVILGGVELGSEEQSFYFRALQADPLYAQLCDRQMCWRARLSPKPFYLGLPRFPRLDDSSEAAAQIVGWVEDYERKTAGLGVCRLIGEYGLPMDDPVVELHDRMTRALEADLRLA